MAEKLRFDGKVVVVTGAGAGLGRAYALLFGERGAKVVVNDLGVSIQGVGQSSSAADKVVEEICAKGGKAVANYDSVENGDAVIKTALDTYGRIDILVNNAGILRDRSFARISDLDWDLIQRVHLRGSFLCTRAAWEHMKKNKYGRIIMTTSSSGLYGNFGQANYGAAKMGLVGLSSTLAVEGKKYNITCNSIAPMAGSRLTETILPPDIVSALKPDYVAPVVLWLCHESCDDTGGVYEVGGGYAAKVQLMKSKGKVVRDKQGMSPEHVRDNWNEICDFAEFTTPRTSAESSGPAYEALSGAADDKVKPNPTAAKTPEAAIGHEFPEGEFRYGGRDVILYALGVGYSTEHKDFLKFLFEMNEDFCTLPTYGAVIGQGGLSGLVSAPSVNIDPTQILHGEQYCKILKPLPTEGILKNKGRIVDVVDKGRGAVFIVDVDTFNESGEKIMYSQSSVYVQRMGGYGGKRTSTVHIPPQDHPDRKPDASIQEKTDIDQAALYRLSGDVNPLHIDPSFAAMGGFDRPILHGLCYFGYSGKHVLQQYCNNDPKNFKAIKVRFTKPVLPGQTLRTDMWKEGSRVFFQTTVVENGNICLSGAYVDIVDDMTAAAAEVEAQEDTNSLQTDIIFTELRDRLKERPALIKKVNAILCLKITKDGQIAKEWTVDLKNAPGAVYNGMPKGNNKASVTITASDSDMMDIASGQLNAQQAFFAGKLKVTGNIMLGPKLETIFKDELSKL